MHMTRKTALVDYNKCRPDECPDGACKAATVCPAKLLHQEANHTVPMTEPSYCRACGDCVRACPLKAIQLISM
jgi:translation initiation factor RLI1